MFATLRDDHASIESMVCNRPFTSSALLARHVGGRLRQHAGLAGVVGVLFDVGGRSPSTQPFAPEHWLGIRCGPTGCCCPPRSVARRWRCVRAAAHPLHRCGAGCCVFLYKSSIRLTSVTGTGLHRHGQVTWQYCAMCACNGPATQLAQNRLRDQVPTTSSALHPAPVPRHQSPWRFQMAAFTVSM